MEEAIKKAMAMGMGGMKPDTNVEADIENDIVIFSREDKQVMMSISRILLDPNFWKCLGKALGWTEFGTSDGRFYQWKQQWHFFIDHLAEGKDPESFFQGLLNH